MKKILSLMMIIAISLYSFSQNNTKINEHDLDAMSNSEGLRSIEGLEAQGYTIIRNFVDLARIGRTADDRTWPLSDARQRPAILTDAGRAAGLHDNPVPEELKGFDTGVNSRFALANNIELPFVGRLRIDIENAIHGKDADPTYEDILKYQLSLLIPDYFRHGNGIPSASLDDHRIRGWQPVGAHFEGIFDGNGFTISGLVSERHNGQGGVVRAQWGDSHRMINGLFGVVNGGTIKNLTVEIGQDIEKCELPPLQVAAVLRNITRSITNFSTFGFQPTQGNNLCPSGTPIVEGGRHEGGVGVIAGILINGYIHNTVTRSRNEDSRMAVREARFGGIAGFVIGGEITNSSSHIYKNGSDLQNNSATGLGSGNQAGRYVGGLVGYTRMGTKIINSYATGTIFQGGIRIGGLVGNASGSLTIIDSFSGTRIMSATGDANNHGHPGGFIGRAIGANVSIINSFSYTTVEHTRVAIPVDGLVGIFYNTIAIPENFSNVFTITPTSVPRAILLTEEQMQNPLIVNNIMNQDESFWHLDQSDESDVVFPSHNPNPEEIQRVRVNAPTTLIRYLDESIPLMRSGYIYLTSGEFTLTLERNGRMEEIDLLISAEDLTQDDPIYIWSVIFITPNNLFHAIAFFREGDEIEGIDPPDIGSPFLGWFDQRTGGNQITKMGHGHTSVWARFDDIIILGNATPGADIILTSTYLVGSIQDEFRVELTTLAGGSFMMPNVPAGMFILEVRLNGFITEIREIDTIGETTIDLGRIDLEEVIISGTAPSNSRINITDSNGNTVRNINDVGTLGNFTFSQLLDGEYFITIQLAGFAVRTETIVVNRESINLNEYFDELERLILTPVAITGTAQEGTVVSLYQGIHFVTSVTVGANRTFIFAADINTVIHNVEYVIVARLARHNEVRREISISGNIGYEYHFNQDEMLSIRGVTSQRTLVQLLDRDTHEVIAYATSDMFGNFELSGLENGYFTLRFVRRNFEVIYEDVEVNYASIDFTVDANNDFVMSRIGSANSVIGVMVQGILVILAGVGIWSILYKKKDTNIRN